MRQPGLWHERRGLLLALLLALPALVFAHVDVTHVRWEQHPGSQLPLELQFRDESSRPVALRDYFGRVPVVLVLGYFSCPQLCPEVLHGVARGLSNTGLLAGRDYELLAVSIDPRDTPARAREEKMHLMGGATMSQGAHFLTTPTDSAATLARISGFQYVYDSEHGQFAHAAGFLILDPRGHISRYFFGVRYPASQVRSALIDAGRGQIASLADQLLLLCYHFDPTQGRYSLAILNVLRVMGIAALLAAGLLWWRLASDKPR